MLRRSSLLAFLLLAVLFSGCSAPRRVAAESLPKEQQPDLVPHSREANDVARFLAGMPGTPGSPYTDLEKNEVWKEHRRIVDAAWQEAEREQLAGLRKFQAEELNAPALAAPSLLDQIRSTYDTLLGNPSAWDYRGQYPIALAKNLSGTWFDSVDVPDPAEVKRPCMPGARTCTACSECTCCWGSEPSHC